MSQWYYADRNRNRQGPVDSQTLTQLFGEGQIDLQTLVWREGLENWKKLADLSDELGLVATPAPPALPPLPSAPIPPQSGLSLEPLDDGSRPATSESGASVSPSAPTPATGIGSDGRAVFGSAEPSYTVESPYTVATPLPTAAAEPAPSAATPPPSAPHQMPPQVQHPLPPPQKKRLSGCLIAVIIGVVALVPILGILVAIAIPAYQEYTLRAKVMQTVISAESMKLSIAQFQAQHGQCPSNNDDGFKPREGYADSHIDAITIGRFESGHCGMEVIASGANSDKVDGKAIWLEYAGDSWQCSSEIDDKLLPAQCRSE